MPEAVRLFWLQDGAIPRFPFQGRLHYMAGGTGDEGSGRLRWEPASFARNAIVPIVDTTLHEFLAFMQEPNVVEGDTLYVAVRTFARLETGTVLGADNLPEAETIDMLLVAAAIVPGEVEGAIPYRWRFEPLSTLAQLCTVNELATEPEHPMLKAAWRQLAESREVYRQWRLVQDRAKRLLEGFLDEAQREEFKKRHRFRVRGPDGLDYLILYEAHGNVWLIETSVDGKITPRENYCVIPDGVEMPIYDLMLAQKLMIETNLAEFKRIANVARFDDEGRRIREPGEVEPERVAV